MVCIVTSKKQTRGRAHPACQVTLSIKLALKLHAHSVQCTYKLANIRLLRRLRSTFIIEIRQRGDTQCFGPRNPLFFKEGLIWRAFSLPEAATCIQEVLQLAVAGSHQRAIKALKECELA
eukprot:462093-Pelagomonas_calceolata.AAC.1